MNIKDVSRDEIKSQLIEGLKHSRKILKNKKGKTNRDLVFTVMDKQFLITRKHGNNYVFFITDDKTRNEFIEIYLDNEIKSDRHGSKELLFSSHLDRVHHHHNHALCIMMMFVYQHHLQ